MDNLLRALGRTIFYQRWLPQRWRIRFIFLLYKLNNGYRNQIDKLRHGTPPTGDGS